MANCTFDSGGSSRCFMVSRMLSKLLRHNIIREGLCDVVTEDGFVPLDRVLSLPKFEKEAIDIETVIYVVKTNRKQRFGIRRDEHGRLWIRANQGHSFEGLRDDRMFDLLDCTAVEPMVFVHGTYIKHWSHIKAHGGLLRMGRSHIHLATGLPEDRGVISGMRSSCELVIYIDVSRAARESGLAFYRSANGVILTRGLGKLGILPMKYFSRVIDRKSGEEIELE